MGIKPILLLKFCIFFVKKIKYYNSKWKPDTTLKNGAKPKSHMSRVNT